MYVESDYLILSALQHYMLAEVAGRPFTGAWIETSFSFLLLE